ncbi:MAG: ATP-binding cassette domain-containing protein [Methanosphaera sp.]|nr:ATP-binding cassette domain-containing protein [Methanosphaera sp.]
MTLKVEKVSYGYKSRSPQILKEVSLSVNNNQTIGLMGDSGSGKTTLCKIISGYITNYEGTVTVDGEIVNKNEYNPVQLIFQHPEKTMNPKWKMKQVLEESWMPPQDVLDEFGIRNSWLDRYPSELSGGELQRFSILRSLNPKTKYVIADEITTMLDAISQVQIWTSLSNYCQKNKVGILIVSHDKKLLDTVCDDIIVLNQINNLD